MRDALRLKSATWRLGGLCTNKTTVTAHCRPQARGQSRENDGLPFIVFPNRSCSFSRQVTVETLFLVYAVCLVGKGAVECESRIAGFADIVKENGSAT